jgi:hypothetical protein
MRPRVVQIEAIYEQFARVLYTRWPGLENLSFQSQIQAVLDSGWSGGQNVVPYLNPSNWERFYLLPKMVAPQIAWAKERGVPPVGWNLRDILFLQLQDIDPDVIYLSDLGSFDFSVLDQLKRKPYVIAWLATKFPLDIPWSRIDLLLSGIGAIRREALRLGVKAVRNFNSGAPSFRGLSWHSAAHKANPMSIGFSGSFLGGYHDERAKMLSRLSAERPHIPIDIYTAQPFGKRSSSTIRFHGPVFASEVVETYARHLIVVDARAEFGLAEVRFNRDTSNMRIFEATRAGSMLLTEYAPNLESMFMLGREIICYRSEDEFIDLASYYSDINHANELKSIAQGGFRRVLAEHTIEHRAEEFERIIRSEL